MRYFSIGFIIGFIFVMMFYNADAAMVNLERNQDFCTGIVVGSKKLITAIHCTWDAKQKPIKKGYYLIDGIRYEYTIERAIVTNTFFYKLKEKWVSDGIAVISVNKELNYIPATIAKKYTISRNVRLYCFSGSERTQRDYRTLASRNDSVPYDIHLTTNTPFDTMGCSGGPLYGDNGQVVGMVMSSQRLYEKTEFGIIYKNEYLTQYIDLVKYYK